MSRRFTVNAPAVVSEVIDGEAVILNLRSGHYFSALHTGAVVWEWIDGGASDEEVAAALASRYGLPASEAARGVSAFLSELLRHELVTEGRTANGALTPALDATRAPASWAPPALSVFTDMEDLLLLDPIHDVGDAGWPSPKSDAA